MNSPAAPLLSWTSSHAPSPDELLEEFLSYCERRKIEPYPAQEEAILEVFAGNHVVLNTPTGSGKSLVALAACFAALAAGERAYYTAPIKALVSEKFFELCRAFGPENVGLMTGDASVNRSAPIICCTAEILSNMALREGEELDVSWAVMDEFHYYSDRDRGVAWQVPLLTLPQAKFVLMTATMGNPEFFVRVLEERTGRSARLVQSFDRPVPLDWEYSENPLQETVATLIEQCRTPIYIVHFSQRAASEEAQNLMSLNLLDKDEKARLKEALLGFRFDSAFGKELRRFVPHGIGVHHAGMLPKYRRLIERLAQAGLLRVICGTDTLGVGINVPIRTVLFTQLCKYDGENTVLLSVRDFQQISGRAGRKGFDLRGSVIVQAPEHEIENRRLKMKAAGNPKKARSIHLRKAPEKGFKPWNAEMLEQLRQAKPEALVSRFQVSHGLLLNLLSRPKGGCRAAKNLLRACHEPLASRRKLRRTSMEMLRSLVDANIVEFTADGLRVHADLQQDFSLNQALSLYAVEAIESLDRDMADFPLVLLSVVESVIETPWAIIYQQIAKKKTDLINELKAQGVEYDERMAQLAQVEHDKPAAEFIYGTFQIFAKSHPWVTGNSISPKSIARDMYERATSFHEYVKEFGLARSEGVLLRYLTDAYRAMDQMVPDRCKDEAVWDLQDWLGAELRGVDASLLDEWRALTGQVVVVDEEEAAAKAPERDVTEPRRAFRIQLRNAAWRLVNLLARRDYFGVVACLRDWGDDELPPRDEAGAVWHEARLEAALEPFHQEFGAPRLDGAARAPAKCVIDEEDGHEWRLRQVLSDPEDYGDWALQIAVDLDETRRVGRPWLQLLAIECPPGG